MFGQGLDVAQAGLRVGYEDASYFTRDYRRFFGAARAHCEHIARIRSQVA